MNPHNDLVFKKLIDFDSPMRGVETTLQPRITNIYDTYTSEHKIKKMLSIDIIKKYNLMNIQGNVQRLHKHTIDVLRSLLVFGEHEYIIQEIQEHDKINVK
jgi:hypothetical protein